MLSVVLAICATLVGSSAYSDPTGRPAIAPQDLIGAWKLVKTEYAGPHGPMQDPVFQPSSKGLIIYDRSGWMSVNTTNKIAQ